MSLTQSDDEFEFYPCTVDGAPASIYVNLKFEHAPPPAADTCYTIAIAMRERGEHGIGTADESEALNTIEEALIAKDLVTYVGRLRCNGLWEIVFYGPAGHLTTLLGLVRDRAGGRKHAGRANRDATWTYYKDLLLPDAERRRWMDDRRIVQILTEQGDRLATPRRVDHHLTFPTTAARDAFLAAAPAAGFTVELTDDLLLHLHREDPIELDHIHDVVMTLVDAATAHGGTYERWTAGIV